MRANRESTRPAFSYPGQHVPLVRALVNALATLIRGDATTLACAMAFQFFLALLPTLALLGWALSWLTHANEELLRGFASALELAPDAARELVETHRVEFAREVAPLAALGAWWLASEPFFVLMSAFEDRGVSHARSWTRRRSIAAACAAGLVLALGLAASLSYWLGVAREELVSAVGLEMSAVNIAAAIATSSLVCLGTALLSTFFLVGIDSRVRPRRLVPGSFLAVVLSAGASWGFALYVRTLASYALYYGSLAAVVVVLLWLWLCSLALLFGAEVNAELERESSTAERNSSASRS